MEDFSWQDEKFLLALNIYQSFSSFKVIHINDNHINVYTHCMKMVRMSNLPRWSVTMHFTGHTDECKDCISVT